MLNLDSFNAAFYIQDNTKIGFKQCTIITSIIFQPISNLS